MWHDSLKTWHVLVALGKLWYLYSGMQRESSMLNSSLKAQNSMPTHNAACCNNCMRKSAGREPGHEILQSVISLGPTGPSTTQTWPCPIRLSCIWATAATFGMSLIPQLYDNMETTVQEWLQMPELKLYSAGILKLMLPWWSKHNNVLGDCAEYCNTAVKQMSCI